MVNIDCCLYDKTCCKCGTPFTGVGLPQKTDKCAECLGLFPSTKEQLEWLEAFGKRSKETNLEVQ